MTRRVTDIVDEGEALGKVAGVLASVPAGLTTEQLQDAVASFIDAGSNVSVTYDDVAGTLTIAATAGTIAVEDEGVETVASATRLDFAGAGVTVTDTGSGQATVTIPGGGGSSDPLFIPAAQLSTIASGGTPTLGEVGGSRAKAWLLDAATSEVLAGSFLLPSAWSAIDIDIYWTNAGAGSGNVVWDVYFSDIPDASTIAVAEYVDTANIIAAPAQDILKVSEILTNQAVTGGQFVHLRVSRTGAHASDTLANDAGLLGLAIRPA